MMKNNSRERYEFTNTVGESRNKNFGVETQLIEPIEFFARKELIEPIEFFDRRSSDITMQGVNTNTIQPSVYNSVTSLMPMGMNGGEFTCETNAFNLARMTIAKLHIKTIGDKEILIYNGKYYESISRQKLERHIVGLWREIMMQYGKTNLVSEVASFILKEPEINSPVLVQDTHRVAFNNLVLNIRNGSIESHSHLYNITYGVNGNYLPGISLVSSVFDRYLYDITGGDKILAYRILQMIGYILTADTSAKKYFVLQGHKDSGKSVLLSLISCLLSPNAVATLDIHTYGDRFPLGVLYGKNLAMSPDLPASPLKYKAVGKIKQITGNDVITTDVKNKEHLSFKCNAKILIATNHRLLLKERDDAFFNRAVVIPFKYSIDDKDKNPFLLEAMLQEKDAIITKAINAYFNLVADGYNFAGSYPINEVVMQGGVDGEDVIGGIYEFAQKNFVPEAGAIVYVADAYEKYMQEGGTCQIGEFSAYFNDACTMKYGTTKTKKRKEPRANPISALEGIAWKKI